MGSLGKVLSEVQMRGVWIALAIALVVGLTGPLAVLWTVSEARISGSAEVVAWIWLAAAACIGSFVGAIAIVAFLPPFLLGRRERTASAVHAWIGAREVRRLFGHPAAAIGIPTTPDEANTWLAAQPDEPRLRPLRLEMLVLSRRFDEARALAKALPQSSTLEQYRVVEGLALVDDQELGEVDLAAVRAALARIPAGIDRVEAVASLAVLEARRAVGSTDWRVPLIAARQGIPGHDWLILVRDHGAPIFRILARSVVPFVALLIISIASLMTLLALWER